jgi:mannose-6-phosphate isomerase-like protein (cupin superfamily)
VSFPSALGEIKDRINIFVFPEKGDPGQGTILIRFLLPETGGEPMGQTYTYIDNLIDQIGEFPEDSILSRTFFQNDHLKALLFGFAPGQELSEHTASVPAIVHILQGEARIILGEDEFQVQAGAWVHMPPEQPHSIQAENEMIMLLYLLE